MTAAGTVLDLVSGQLRRDPGRPCLTFYDATSGERVELSWVTFDNWVSKVANLFIDELDAEPGDAVSIELPTHWLGPAVLVGGWAAGLVAAYGDAAGDARIHVVGPDALAAAPASSGGTVVACSLRPLGGRFTEPLPPGWLDFAVEVPPQPDALMQPAVVSAATSAVTTSTGTVTHDALLAAAHEKVTELGLEPGGRLATDLNPVDAEAMALVLAAWTVGGSVVLVVHADDDQRAMITEQERVSRATWSG
jgi:uncharacterized protein (TIGR03089 family)